MIDAVGMEAHGEPVKAFAHRLLRKLPAKAAAALIERAGIDRLAVLNSAIEVVRRGGTISISGVYGGTIDPLPMMALFDKQIQLRMGQANVKRWVDDVWPLVTAEDDPLGVEELAAHHLPLDETPRGYELFQRKEDGAIKVLLRP